MAASCMHCGNPHLGLICPDRPQYALPEWAHRAAKLERLRRYYHTDGEALTAVLQRDLQIDPKLAPGPLQKPADSDGSDGSG